MKTERDLDDTPNFFVRVWQRAWPRIKDDIRKYWWLGVMIFMMEFLFGWGLDMIAFFIAFLAYMRTIDIAEALDKKAEEKISPERMQELREQFPEQFGDV